MKANCYWLCQDCRVTNLTQADTVSPHVQLVCSECHKPQHVRLTLENSVEAERPALIEIEDFIRSREEAQP